MQARHGFLFPLSYHHPLRGFGLRSGLSQDTVRHTVRCCRRKAERRNLDCVGKKCIRTPFDYGVNGRAPLHEKAYHLVHAIERHKSKQDRYHRQRHGQIHLPSLPLGIGEERFHPAFLLCFHFPSL